MGTGSGDPRPLPSALDALGAADVVLHDSGVPLAASPRSREVGEVRELAIDDLNEASGGLPPLALAIDLLIARLFSSLRD